MWRGHAAAWPSLSTQRGMEDSFDVQVEALSRAHALTAQCFVVVAQSPLTQQAVDLMDAALGPQDMQPAGGGWSAIIHPTATDVVPPKVGPAEGLLVAEIDLADAEALHLLIDGRGHYARREVLRLWIDDEPKDAVVERGPAR